MTRLASSKCGCMNHATIVHAAVVANAQPYRARRTGCAPWSVGATGEAERPGSARSDAANDHDIEAARQASQFGGGGRPQPCAPAAPLRSADDQARRPPSLRIFDQRLGCSGAAERHGLRAKGLRQAQQIDTPVALLRRQPEERRRLDAHRRPVRRRAHQRVACRRESPALPGCSVRLPRALDRAPARAASQSRRQRKRAPTLRRDRPCALTPAPAEP